MKKINWWLDEIAGLFFGGGFRFIGLVTGYGKRNTRCKADLEKIMVLGVSQNGNDRVINREPKERDS